MSGAQSARSVVEASPRSRAAAGVVVVIYALVTVLPLVWIVATSFKSQSDAISYPPKVCTELRTLRDRIKATTVYVTHDQMEAMALADVIGVMNGGVVEQLDTPRNIYARPATVFVASFIGSPAMNLLPCHDSVRPGRERLRLGDAEIAIPDPREALDARGLLLGVRPEHVRLNDAAALRGEVFGTEYLGSTQIVTVTTAHGNVRARLPAAARVEAGDLVGLTFVADKLSLFDAGTGRAIRTVLHDPAPAPFAVEAAHG